MDGPPEDSHTSMALEGMGTGYPGSHCPLCNKYFQQETSYIRHIEYCRRRAARGESPRQSACRRCSRAKIKCDFKSPCSACTAKRVICSNRKAIHISPSRDGMGNEATSTADTDLGFRIQPSVANDSPPAVHSPSPSLQLLAPESLYNFNTLHSNELALFSTNFDQVLLNDDAGIDMRSGMLGAFTPSVFPLLEDLNRGSSLQQAPLELASAATSHHALDLARQSFVAVPRDRTAKLPSDGCRRFIASILRTYPQMMAGPSTLPPFIHPLSCGFAVELSGSRSRWNKNIVDMTLELPSAEILANCISISQMFVAWTPMSDKMLWRTLQAEQRRLLDELPLLSKSEVLAATQATLLYLIMGVIHSGPGYLVGDKPSLHILADLSNRFAEVCPGPFSLVDMEQPEVDWRDWILEESRRRVGVLCYLLGVVAGNSKCRSVDPRVLPLPSHRDLWEANSHREWEAKYFSIWSELKANRAGRLCTVGDLIAAQQNVMLQGGAGGDLARLDAWNAGVDGLGMMLTAVTAAV
ncbi:hypothetical protein GQ53DRAFT_838389 [Thozetella sp. PMI_491]|nr:hypothetical protein GQ53DRAFT_838389 [Thozetella sp. PMI_491]